MNGRGPIVRLTWGELTAAAYVGISRQVCALQNGYKQVAAAERNENAWERHVIGAICEPPVAKYFNLFWFVAIGEIDQTDVGRMIEVRGVTRETDGLVIRPKDLEKKAALPFVLVFADPPDFELVGWIVARDAKQERFVTNFGNGRPPAWRVPRAGLKHVDELGKTLFGGRGA